MLQKADGLPWNAMREPAQLPQEKLLRPDFAQRDTGWRVLPLESAGSKE